MRAVKRALNYWEEGEWRDLRKRVQKRRALRLSGRNQNSIENLR